MYLSDGASGSNVNTNFNEDGFIDDENNELLSSNYQIHVSRSKHDDPEIIHLYGIVENRCDWDWDKSHLVGIRRFFDAAGLRLNTIEEFRADMVSPFIRSGDEGAFLIRLPLARLPIGAVSCEIDVVNEHTYWHSENGAQPLLFDLDFECNRSSRLAWLAWLYRCHAVTRFETKAKLEIIQDVVHHMNFSQYDKIDQLMELIKNSLGGAPIRIPAPSSRTVTESCDRDDVDGGVKAFLRHFALNCGVPTRDLDDPLAQARVFRRFIREGKEFFKGGCAPVSPAFSHWLSQRALPYELASTPATRSIFAALAPDQQIALNSSDDGESLVWWFATRVLLDGGLSQKFIPELVKQKLITPSTRQNLKLRFPEPTPFMRRLHADEEVYRSRYNLDTDEGRLGFSFDLLLLGLENETYRAFLGPEILSWMVTPVDDAVSLSPFEIILFANLSGITPPQGKIAEGKLNIIPAAQAIRGYHDWLPHYAALEPTSAVRIIGMASSQTGLGVNLRMSASALTVGGLAAEVLDTETGLLQPPLAPTSATSLKLTKPIDLFHLNADAIPALVARYSDWRRSDVYRIGFALWEASVMPEQHRAGITLLNEIWAPTAYVSNIYRNAGFENVHVVGKGIDLPRAEPFDLRRIGVEPGDFTFLMSFDVDSWVERKNPIAALEAFQRAFPRDPRVKMVLKVVGLRDHPGDRTRQVARIINIAEHDKRILIVNDHYSFASYLGLIAAVDATVSPHRSEGFGYVPAYSLLLGTPTLVTDHSGPVDFCTEETSFPIKCDLIDIGSDDFVYNTPGAQWADIDVDALADAMIQVRMDPEAANLRAAKGGALLRKTCSVESMAKRYSDRIQQILGI